MAHKCFSNHTNHTRPRAITTRRVTLALCHQQSLFHTEQIDKIRAHGLRPKNNSPIYHMLKRDSARSQLGVFTSALKMEQKQRMGHLKVAWDILGHGPNARGSRGLVADHSANLVAWWLHDSPIKNKSDHSTSLLKSI